MFTLKIFLILIWLCLSINGFSFFGVSVRNFGKKDCVKSSSNINKEKSDRDILKMADKIYDKK